MKVTNRSGMANVFSPGEIERLSAALESALGAVRDSGVDSEISGRDIRRRLAARIISDAQGGEFDPDRLAEAALASLRGAVRTQIISAWPDRDPPASG